MKIINNDVEYEEWYYYTSRPKSYPKSYPCFVKRQDEDFGIMGSAYVFYAKYIPSFDGLTPMEIFTLGVTSKWKVI